jgi:hypothetical protein
VLVGSLNARDNNLISTATRAFRGVKMRTPLSTMTFRLSALMLCGFAASEADASGLTGTYVGKGDHAAFILQIVETGSRLTGRYEEFAAKSDGKFDDNTFAFSAAVDGDHFAGTIKNSGFIGTTIPVSGDVKGDTLRLEGDASFHLTLSRGDQVDFRRSVADIKGEAAASKQIALVNDLVASMKAFDGRQREATSTLPALEKRIVDNSSKMASEVERERSVRGDGQRSVERGQISVAIHQLGVDSSQARRSANVSFSELSSASKTLLVKAGDIKMGMACPSTKSEASRSACSRFAEDDAVFERSVDQMRAAFEDFGEVWNRESVKQQALMRASDTAVN